MADLATTLPRSLLAQSRVLRLGPSRTPALLIHPRFDRASGSSAGSAPYLFWMHGRTAQKELDSGRYLRLLRAGIATVAIDLPGHGERAQSELQTSERSLEVVESMLGELPGVLEVLKQFPEFDSSRCAIGGFSLGAMTALAAMCRPHPFKAALIEASSGDWSQLVSARHDPGRAAKFEPLRHLDSWKPTPLLALHAAGDQMVAVGPQRDFIAEIRRRTPASLPVIWHEFGPTGAPAEHIGFGTCAAEAKTLGTKFLVEQLLPIAP
ncbi:MAG: alpha/beta fold hydrolase [Planctomycetes bacterium]|nr:alpha/beta fold hydrolase [Planctomycetota bacterium]